MPTLISAVANITKVSEKIRKVFRHLEQPPHDPETR